MFTTSHLTEDFAKMPPSKKKFSEYSIFFFLDSTSASQPIDFFVFPLSLPLI